MQFRHVLCAKELVFLLHTHCAVPSCIAPTPLLHQLCTILTSAPFTKPPITLTHPNAQAIPNLLHPCPCHFSHTSLHSYINLAPCTWRGDGDDIPLRGVAAVFLLKRGWKHIEKGKTPCKSLTHFPLPLKTLSIFRDHKTSTLKPLWILEVDQPPIKTKTQN